MSQSYVLKHVLTCPIMGSHGYIFLWNDFGMVQILHGRFWRHHKRQASPHSIRRHPYFFKTNATLLSSGLNFFFHFNFLACLLLVSSLSDTYLLATPLDYRWKSNTHKNHQKNKFGFFVFIDDFFPFLCS